MLKISEQRRRRQARQIETKFDRVVAQMRQFGEAAGKFAQINRAAGQTYTMGHVETMASASVDEVKASIDVPLAGLRSAGVKVDVALNEAALRSAFRDGFLSGLGPDGIATQGTA